MRRRLPIALAVLLLAPALRAADSSPGSRLTVVYVESNVGGASGGHVAARLGHDVYHFQADGGRLRLARDDWVRFRHHYTELENRSLHLAHLDLGAGEFAALRDRFAERFFRQERDLGRRRRLAADLAWLRAFAGEAPLPRLPGAGLFAPAARPDPHGMELRRRIATRRGAGFLAERTRRIEARLARFARAGGIDDLETYREDLLEREAIRALEEARPVAPGLLVTPGGAPLAPREVESLERFRSAQEEAVLALLGSPRPDRGRSLLLAAARHRAVSRSLAEGRLVLLDVLPDDAEVIVPASGRERELSAELADRLAGLLAELRGTCLAGEAPSESRYNLLEECATRRRELSRGARGGAIRDRAGRLLPSRGRLVAGPRPRWDAAPLIHEARERIEGHERLLAQASGYDLVTRNCATELVALLGAAFPGEGEAERALGARLEPGSRLGFVPWLLYREVCARCRVAATEVLPSRRRRELETMYAEEPAALVYAREATTVTSTAYRARSQDGAFLLFTDDVFWPRPLYGLANLGYGLANAVAGVPAAPFDGGERLGSGLSGAFYSLPELAFVNIRKGTYDRLGGSR